MAYIGPWSNFHELNLDWILEQLKQLYIRSMDNDENIGEMVEQIVETYKRNEV